MHTVNYFSGWCLVASLLGMYYSGTKWVSSPQGGLGVWLPGIGAVSRLGFAEQALLAKGLQLESARRGALVLFVQVSERKGISIRCFPRGMLMNGLQIVFALMLDRIFFGVVMSKLSMLGSVIIISAAMFLIVSTFLSRTIFSFLVPAGVLTRFRLYIGQQIPNRAISLLAPQPNGATAQGHKNEFCLIALRPSGVGYSNDDDAAAQIFRLDTKKGESWNEDKERR